MPNKISYEILDEIGFTKETRMPSKVRCKVKDRQGTAYVNIPRDWIGLTVVIEVER